jgi:hypothetical protein
MNIRNDQPQFEVVENYEPPRTSCEEYGHDYVNDDGKVERRCRDCGEEIVSD